MSRCVLLILLCAGCDLLFPEFAGTPPANTDAAVDDGDGTPHIAGLLCVLGDVRDFRSCATGVPATMRVTVEETRDVAPVDSTGHFNLPLSKKLDSAILAAADSGGTFTPTVTNVVLSGGHADGLAVPVVQANVLSQVALQNGIALDERRGVIFGWATNGQGLPIAGVSAIGPAGAEGPFYDGPQASDVQAASATSVHGLIVYFNVPPGDALIVLGKTQFKLPVRANALTLSLLVNATP